MVVFNYSGAEINAKVVYYGPALSGKTTNLEYIYEQMPDNAKGKMVSMKTRTDRTLFFDFLPLELGEINGYRTRILLYTVPGQVYYNATRKLVLKGADAVVFVADSSPRKMDENLESLRNLEDNLNEHGLTLDTIPWILQYNKRDLSDALPTATLDQKLNLLNVPSYEATATTGEGIYETFQAVAKLLYGQLADRLKKAQPAPKASDGKAPQPTVHNAPAPDSIPEAPSRSLPSEFAVPPAAPKAQKGSGNRDPNKTVTDVLDVALREVGGGSDSSPRSLESEQQGEPDDREFKFAQMEKGHQDADVGRVIDFDEKPPAPDDAPSDSDFVRNPFDQGDQPPGAQKKAPRMPVPDPKPKAAKPETAYHPSADPPPKAPKPPRAPVKAAPKPPLPPPPPQAEPDAVTISVPVILTRSQIGDRIPITIELDIQVADDD